jgi:hypothetical protein
VFSEFLVNNKIVLCDFSFHAVILCSNIVVYFGVIIPLFVNTDKVVPMSKESCDHDRNESVQTGEELHGSNIESMESCPVPIEREYSNVREYIKNENFNNFKKINRLIVKALKADNFFKNNLKKKKDHWSHEKNTDSFFEFINGEKFCKNLEYLYSTVVLIHHLFDVTNASHLNEMNISSYINTISSKFQCK